MKKFRILYEVKKNYATEHPQIQSEGLAGSLVVQQCATIRELT